MSAPNIRRLVDEYASYLRGASQRQPMFAGLDDDLLALVERHARRLASDPFDERLFLRKMKELRPAAVQPLLTDPPSDLYLALAQPEILHGFWPLLRARTGSRGPDPGIAAKALLFTVAALGHSAHLKDNHRLLATDARLRQTFEAIEARAAAGKHTRPSPLNLRSYEQTLRQLHALADGVDETDCIEANIALVKEIHALLGVHTVHLGIDATLWKAWVTQVGKRDAEREARICRAAPNAKPRLIEDPKRSWAGRFIRGYHLVALVDLATGLPLTWTMVAGDRDEVRALTQLLYTLYALWPDINADVVVADAAWDERWAAEWTLRRYGLHLVAHRHPSRLDTKYELSPFESKSIAAFFGDGRAVCRACGGIMVRDGSEGRRDPLLALGELAPVSAFRLRYTCPNCQTRPHLHMHRDWISLAYYPHSLAAGNPGLHAERLALLSYRNRVEALFSGLQVGHKLGLAGSSRWHSANEQTTLTTASVALLMRSALMAAHLRELAERDTDA